MSRGVYYGPVGETPTDIYNEKCFLLGGYATFFVYGIQLALYIRCMRILCNVTHRGRFTLFLLFYITLLCATNTIWTATWALQLQLAFIENRNFPGGIIRFLNVETSWPVDVASYTSYIIGNILADALLLWRCRVIWSASLGSMGDYLMIFPTILFLASLAMGIKFDIGIASGDLLVNGPSSTSLFAVLFFVFSLSLNVVLTGMIAGRIWYYQRNFRSTAGDVHPNYSSIASMFIESALIYSVFSLLLLITFGLGDPTNQIWQAVIPAVQLISSYLIIHRVAQGRAWSSDTLNKVQVGTSIEFHRSIFTTTHEHELAANQDILPTNNMIVHVTAEEVKVYDNREDTIHFVNTIQPDSRETTSLGHQSYV